VVRGAGKTETMQENIQDCLELDEGDPGFHLLVFLLFLNKGIRVIFLFSFISTTPLSLNCTFFVFQVLWVFRFNFRFINPDVLPQIDPNYRGFTLPTS
jgi:hypothetical protein